jgi:hypothetical protein
LKTALNKKENKTTNQFNANDTFDDSERRFCNFAATKIRAINEVARGPICPLSFSSPLLSFASCSVWVLDSAGMGGGQGWIGIVAVSMPIGERRQDETK